ncbi:MAG: leucine-rich repeat protein [Clostridia bacterium]|nr:leucine-rich repeat protein [Clostridia bacterium]
MKKFLCLVLSIIMVFSLCTSLANAEMKEAVGAPVTRAIATGLPYGSLTYTIENNGSVTITGCAQDASGDIVIPDTLLDPWTNAIALPVTAIADEAFRMCMNITSIHIPDSVTSIGERAFFGCTALASVNLPTNLTTLGAYAFNLCKSIKSINIPNTLKVISDYAFKGCASLTAVTIPASVTTIGTEAFADCIMLKDLTVKGTLSKIGNSAFRRCTSLTNAFFEALPPTSFGTGVFENASPAFSIYYYEENANAWAPNGEKTYSSDAYPISAYNSKMSGTYDGLKYIVEDTNTVTIVGFDEAKIQSTLVIPDKIGGRYVTAIESFSLTGCSKIQSVVIPETINSIGDYAFYGCSSLTSAYFRGAVPQYFGAGVFDDAAPEFKIYYRFANVSSWAPNGEKTRFGYPIASYSNISSGTYGIFEYNVTDQGTISITGLTDGVTGAIEIPSAINGFPVTDIAANAFFGMTDLTAITMPSSIETIGMMAFSKCEKLTQMVIPDSVVSIGASTFAGCYALKEVVIGSSLSSFGSFWTFNCYALDTITVSEANPNFTSVDGVVYNKDVTKLVAFPPAKTGAFTFPGTVSSMDSSAMSGTLITSVTLPAAMTSIPSSAFASCPNLTAIIFPDTLTEIGSSAFSSCTALETVRLPASLTTLGASAFAKCEKLKSAYFLGDKPTSSGYFVFNSVAEGFTIYYLADRASSWAPNNEDNWYGYPIAPYGASDVTRLTPTFGSPYTVSAGVLKGITKETKVSDIIATFEDSASIRIVTADGTIILTGNDIAGTGSKIQLVKNSAVVDEITVLLPGDITGDGKINSRDIASLQRHVTGSTLLEGIYFAAANANDDIDADGNPKVNSRDIAELQRIVSA